MIKKLTLNFLMVICLLFTSSEASAILKSVPSKMANIESVYELNPEALLNMDKAALADKLGRRLTIKEKFGLKYVKRKLKKNPNLNSSEALESAKMDGLAIAGFVSGIVGLFVFGIILGLLAIIFSAIALGRMKKHPDLWKGKGLAIAGLVIGIVSVGLLLIVLAAVL